MNVTFRITRYSVILPFWIFTFWSFTHAPVRLRSVLSAREMPAFTASSKLFFDEAWISVILATALRLLR